MVKVTQIIKLIALLSWEMQKKMFLFFIFVSIFVLIYLTIWGFEIRDLMFTWVTTDVHRYIIYECNSSVWMEESILIFSFFRQTYRFVGKHALSDSTAGNRILCVWMVEPVTDISICWLNRSYYGIQRFYCTVWIQ